MHNQIETYSIDDKNSSREFILKDMRMIYDLTNGEPDKPHRHDYFTMMIVEEATGTHAIDFYEYEMFGHSLFFIYPGQVHQVILSTPPKGWVINFTRHFLIKNNIPDQMVNDVYLFNKYGEAPPLSINQQQWQQYIDLIRQIEQYSNLNLSYKDDALGAFLKLLLIQSNNHCSLHQETNPQNIETGNQLLRKYKHLIDKHYKEYHKVSDYAEMLAITSDYLNRSIKSITGKSAKEFITERIIVEAKRVLLFTEQTNKELAYDLGFEEQAHFSNFFKKLNGVSPNDFRNSARSL